MNSYPNKKIKVITGKNTWINCQKTSELKPMKLHKKPQQTHMKSLH